MSKRYTPYGNRRLARIFREARSSEVLPKTCEPLALQLGQW